ncbi:MAG: hypothetical protein OCD02_08445 [Spirochaetaceae bacterium]
MSSVLKQYDTKLDSKHRITVRGANYDYYHVIEFEDGKIELQPRILIDPQTISSNTLVMMDSSIKNLKENNVSDPIDLSEFNNEL